MGVTETVIPATCCPTRFLPPTKAHAKGMNAKIGQTYYAKPRPGAVNAGIRTFSGFLQELQAIEQDFGKSYEQNR